MTGRLNMPGFFHRQGVYYGWVVVAVSFVLISLIFGVRLSFGIFFDFLTRATPDAPSLFAWSRADAAGVFSVTMLVFALFSAPSGWLLDRAGSRLTFALGLLVMASGLVMTSRMQNLAQFYLYYGVWTGIGVTIVGLSIYAAAISLWFSRQGRRGLAIGLAYSGTGIGILFLAPLLERYIVTFGWRSAYLFLAGLIFFVALPLTLLFIRDNPYQLGLRPQGEPADSPGPASPQLTRRPPLTAEAWTFGRALRTPVFYLVLLCGALSLFTVRMVSVHQVAHFVDHGISRLTAATVFGSAGILTAISFILFGSLSDRIGRYSAFYIGAVAQVIALTLLIFLRQNAPLPFLYIYAAFWGVGEGSRSGMITTIASDAFPGPAIGVIVGTLGSFFGVGAAIGSWLAGWVFDVTGSYGPAFATALAASLLATLAVYLISRMTSVPQP